MPRRWRSSPVFEARKLSCGGLQEERLALKIKRETGMPTYAQADLNATNLLPRRYFREKASIRRSLKTASRESVHVLPMQRRARRCNGREQSPRAPLKSSLFHFYTLLRCFVAREGNASARKVFPFAAFGRQRVVFLHFLQLLTAGLLLQCLRIGTTKTSL